MHSNRLFQSTIVALAIALLAPAATTYSQNTERQPAEAAKAQAHALSDAFRSVYRSTAPSVVNIRSTQRIQLGENPMTPSPLEDEFFRRFFGRDLPEGFRFGPNPQMPPPERSGEGTGIVAREDGYLVTNNHVVEGATSIKVRLSDESEYDATVVGTDPETDLAVVKIDISGLTPARFGNSDEIEIGDWVLALGSPLGLEQTMTAGIVSAKGRNLGRALDITFQDFIQTDCAINPGNSGGPLVNLNGEVVGINTAISTRTGFYMGVGFAIPSNIAKPVIDTLIEGGIVRRGWLGVQIGPLTPEAAEYAGFEGTRGVLIAEVLPDGPAQTSGVKAGDIVTQINARSVTEPGQLLNIIAATPPGERARLTVFREGKLREINVTLGDRSEQQLTAARPRETPERQPGAGELGIVVRNLTPEIAKRLGAEDREGVVVAHVAVGSIAGDAGVQAGDIVSMVNETKVATVQEFNAAVRAADLTKVVRLQIVREGATAFLYLKSKQR